ncbi:DUF6919 domain-containing protein [Streptomyces sp. NPDC088746]|uniref:DUF6919 domain-containing protein n=1 Tax=Streptomyces sp. NPDC088746 TaxID=3365885 RepID=UPI0037F2702A
MSATMSRNDQRLWKSAKTLADLGELTAQWLEGTIASQPGYEPGFGPDEETSHLVPSLAALCRAKFVTTCSQPGEASTGPDGRVWEQRAAVEGIVAPELVDLLIGVATDAGLIVRVNDHSRRRNGRQDQPVIVTTWDREPFTVFGGPVSPEDMAVQWSGLSRRLYSEVAHGTYVAIAAPEYGTAGERLWPTLDRFVNLLKATR